MTRDPRRNPKPGDEVEMAGGQWSPHYLVSDVGDGTVRYWDARQRGVVIVDCNLHQWQRRTKGMKVLHVAE